MMDPPPPQVVKVESVASALTLSQSSELHFLRSRVRELEREKAELSAENQRLKTMLVHGESRSTITVTSSTCSQNLTGS